MKTAGGHAYELLI